MAVTPLKLKFGRLLGNYLKNVGIRQNDLADRLGVSGSAVSQIIHGKIVPSRRQLDLMCEMLQLDRIQIFELVSLLSKIRTGAETLVSPFNEMVFALRCQRGLTRQQLSNLSGVSSSHIEVFETCFDAVPTEEEAERIAPILGCSAATLLQKAGVGGFSAAAAPELEAGESKGGYRAERRIPLLDLCDLDSYDGTSPVMEFASRHAVRGVEAPGLMVPELFAVQASGRELALGLPGMLMLVLAPERPEGFRKLDLCRGADGRYLLCEPRRGGGEKEFRLAGTRRGIGEVLWRIPVLELNVRLAKSRAGAGEA